MFLHLKCFKHFYFRHGAEVVEKGSSSASNKGKQTFKGTGYRLGQSEADTQGSKKANVNLCSAC